jgi:hypothetical protein
MVSESALPQLRSVKMRVKGRVFELRDCEIAKLHVLIASEIWEAQHDALFEAHSSQPDLPREADGLHRSKLIQQLHTMCTDGW